MSSIRRMFAAALTAMALAMPMNAFADAAPPDSAAQQALQEQAAQIGAGAKIAYAAFTQSDVAMGPAETIQLTASLDELVPGQVYTVSGMLVDGRGGYVASGTQQPTAETTFTADMASPEASLTFTVDTTQYPGQHWSAALVLTDASGSTLSTFTTANPIAVTEPTIQADVTQGDVQGTLAVSFLVTVSGLAPNEEYLLTGSLTADAADAPYRVDGQELSSSVPISLSVSDRQMGIPANAEVLLEVPMNKVPSVSLIPIITLSRQGTVVSQKRTAPLSLGAVQTWSPQMDETPDGDVHIGHLEDDEPEAEESAYATPEPINTPVPVFDEAIFDLASADAKADAEILSEEQRQEEEKDALTSLLIGAGIAGGVALAALLAWKKYKANQRGW